MPGEDASDGSEGQAEAGPVPETKLGPLFRYSARHGEMPRHPLIASRAQLVVRSVWQLVHGFGILYVSVIDGVMKANVWLRTLMSAIVCAILGMWHATQSFPALPAR